MDMYWTMYWTIPILVGLCQLGVSQDDPVASQLYDYAKKHSEKKCITSSAGHPVDNVQCAMTAGKWGPMVMDSVYFENMGSLDRENIPERVVHARGSGAFGYLEITHDITKYCKADLFSEVGKKTPIAVRFSIATAQRGTAETIRDTRGMSVKHYTKEGIWDLPASSFPTFFFRDPSFSIHFSHATKRNPRTNIVDLESAFDFYTSRPETIHTVLFLFGDRGIPDGYRYMDGFGVNTFKLVNNKDEIFYAKFIYKTNLGTRTLTSEKARNISAVDPDYATRDLYNAIERKEYPSWTFYMQVMPEEDAAKYRWNIYDPTKVWFHKDYPLIPIGKIVLNRNPLNYHAEIEQLAFCPANFVPGIGPSLDRVLQGRIFAYPDTQKHRLGPNYNQLPVNFPRYGMKVNNYNRDGPMEFFNQEDQPNYYPNHFNGPVPNPAGTLPAYNISGIVKRWDLGDEDNYSQPQIFWKTVLTEEEKKRLIDVIVDLAKQTKLAMRERIVQYFHPVDEDLGKTLVKKLKVDPKILKCKQDGS